MTCRDVVYLVLLGMCFVLGCVGVCVLFYCLVVFGRQLATKKNTNPRNFACFLFSILENRPTGPGHIDQLSLPKKQVVVHILRSSTFKSAWNLPLFNASDFQIVLARKHGANVSKLNSQKCSEPTIF